MTIYLACPDVAPFIDYNLTDMVANATEGEDTPWTTNGINCGGTVRNGGYVDIGASLVSGWAHMQHEFSASFTVCDQYPFSLWNDANGEELFRLDTINGYLNMQYHNGSSFVTLVPTLSTHVVWGEDASISLDISWKMDNTTGYIRIYSDGMLLLEYEGDTIFRTSTDIDRVGFHSMFFSNGGSRFSSFIISDECTIGCHVAELIPEADGVTMDWDGADTNGGHLDIEAVALDDTTSLVAGTNGLVALFAATDVNAAIANNWAIHGVGVNFRAQSDGAAPQQVRAVLRSGGANYVGSTEALVNGTYQGRHAEWQTDPDDAAAITEADANAFEIGFECVT